MSMPKLAAAIFVGLFALACGAIPGGQGNLAPPSPPTSALARWAGFPVNAKPRPIIWFGGAAEDIGEGQFTTNEAKIAWGCRKFVLASGLQLTSSSPAPGTANWLSGLKVTYSTTIGSEAAFKALVAQRGETDPNCASMRPFTITVASLGTASFGTDRGEAVMTAWVFDVPEIKSSIAYPALESSAYWTGHPTDEMGLGAKVSADGKTLTISLVGGPERGACGIDYTAAAAESSTAVAVAIKAYPHETGAACDLVGYPRTVSVVLKAPLGDRVFLDQNGNVGSASL
jgi:hypothetical protein